MSKQPAKLVIFHANCDDGFASALACHLRYPDAEFHPGVYGRQPPEVEDRDVLIVDFSYSRETLEQMTEEARSVTIYDHHKTAQADIQQLIDEGLLQGEFDMHRAGSMITWEALFPGKRPPMLFDYIQDRDLWLNQLSNQPKVITALRSYPQTFEAWQPLLGAAGVARLASEGEHIHRYYETLVSEALTRATGAVIHGISVPCVNVPHYLASDVAGRLAEGERFAAAWWENGAGGRVFSLRSTAEGADVSEVARRYGGGGHRHSAGFTLKKGQAL